jgi:hydrogenase maturation protease
MDDVLGASRLLVVDTILTGGARPGAVSILTADQMRPVGGSPHFLGLFEVLALGKRLGLPVPEETIVIAVEAFDCTTVGGGMHPDVQSAIPEVVELVGRILADGSPDPVAGGKGG